MSFLGLFFGSCWSWSVLLLGPPELNMAQLQVLGSVVSLFGMGVQNSWQRSCGAGQEPGGGKLGFGIQMFAALSPLLKET